MKAFIIHGSYGNPEENWFPWLKEELEALGHEVFVPKFPTPENQTLENWMKVFEPHIDKIDEETVFIGHSLGPAFILNLLEKINTKIKACFFVAGFIGAFTGKYANPDFDEINRTFAEREFDWEKIKSNCGKFYVYHSDNDPYVSLEKGKKLAENLDSELNVISGAGHFNESAGYTEFKQLLEDIKKEI